MGRRVLIKMGNNPRSNCKRSTNYRTGAGGVIAEIGNAR